MIDQLRLCPFLTFLLFFFCCTLPVSSTQHLSQDSEIYSTFDSSYKVETIAPARNMAMELSSPPCSSSSLSSNRKVVKVVVATAAITLAIVGVLFFLYQKCARRRYRGRLDRSFRREIKVNPEHFLEGNRMVEGFVDGNNRRNRDKKLETMFLKVVTNPGYEEKEEEKRVNVVAERWKHRKSEEQVLLHEPSSPIFQQKVTEQLLPIQRPEKLPVLIPPVQNPALSQPPPPSPLALPPPPPPPPPPPALPPPPLMREKKTSAAPSLHPKAGGSISTFKSPPAPIMKTNNKIGMGTSAGESMRGTNIGQTKLKPLHWDKIIAKDDHSVVWDQINNGSFRLDDNLIEALFGYSVSNPNTPQRNTVWSSLRTSNLSSTAQRFILEPRKSQNIAIILKSLAISQREILDAVLDGHGLTADVLEKLYRISPSKEEETKILQFSGNPTELADADSFLYYTLKAVPSAFTRINAMLFRSNYDADVLHLKESLQTLELGCKELRRRGLLFKLLEAILKAGNRMNAGTSRGNAQGFNLTALRKLSDVKSTDGKTTLLHFVVEQVVRSEGRRRAPAINQNQTLERNNSQRGLKSESNSDIPTAEETNKQYLLQGLPALEALSVEFSNVKKAATVEYASFINTCSSLTTCVTQTRQIMFNCGKSEGGGFVSEMKGFLEECEEELKVVKEEQERIMELVKRTTNYYQTGISNHKGSNPIQLFIIVKDFLDMVDRVRIDISQKLQKKNAAVISGSSSSPKSLPTSPPVRFPDFIRSQLMSAMPRAGSSSESEDDF